MSTLQLHVQLRLFTVTASDDFAQDITILQYTGQAHALVHWNKRSYTMQSWFQLLKNIQSCIKYLFLLYTNH